MKIHCTNMKIFNLLIWTSLMGFQFSNSNIATDYIWDGEGSVFHDLGCCYDKNEIRKIAVIFSFLFFSLKFLRF